MIGISTTGRSDRSHGASLGVRPGGGGTSVNIPPACPIRPAAMNVQSDEPYSSPSISAVDSATSGPATPCSGCCSSSVAVTIGTPGASRDRIAELNAMSTNAASATTETSEHPTPAGSPSSSMRAVPSPSRPSIPIKWPKKCNPSARVRPTARSARSNTTSPVIFTPDPFLLQILLRQIQRSGWRGRGWPRDVVTQMTPQCASRRPGIGHAEHREAR